MPQSSLVELAFWTPLLTALAGGVLGAAVTVYAKKLGLRHTDKLALEERRAALWEDRRDAIYAFLEATQAVDKLVETQEKTGHRDDDEVRAKMHAVWYRVNCLNIVGSQRLKDAKQDFAWRMHEAVWRGHPPEYRDVYAYMQEERDKFITVARDELYSPDVYRESPSTDR